MKLQDFFSNYKICKLGREGEVKIADGVGEIDGSC